jgi:hypothetical protein
MNEQPILFLKTTKQEYVIGIIYLSIYIYIWLYSPCGPWTLFQLPDLYTVVRTPWTEDQPVASPLPTQRHPCLGWIRTHDPSIRAGEDGSCLRPRGHRDRRIEKMPRGEIWYSTRLICFCFFPTFRLIRRCNRVTCDRCILNFDPHKRTIPNRKVINWRKGSTVWNQPQ